MPRSSHLNPDKILRFLQLRNDPASILEIAKGLHIGKAEQKQLLNLVGGLKKRRAIQELPGGRYRLAGGNPAQKSKGMVDSQGSSTRSQRPEISKQNEAEGRLVLHQDGYGFVVLDKPIPELDGDLFIPPGGVGEAMHGDRVLAKIQKFDYSRGSKRAEGFIVRVLDRAHPSVVGQFRYKHPRNVVLPYDSRIQHEIEIPPGYELTVGLAKKLGFSGNDELSLKNRRIPELTELRGAVVDVELLRYPRGGLPPVGRVKEILGKPGELGVDTEIIIRKHYLPHFFSEDVLQEAQNRATQVTEAGLASREDLRRLPIVTIDGETARDFDDAVYVERRPDGGWQLQVHIADVAHYVRTETVLDQEARLRGTSVYFPDRAVPMLPEVLSNGMCSLKPREDRLVMSALMEFDAVGNMKSSRMTAGVICSAERMTYTNVNKVLEGDAEMLDRYASLAHRFRDMKELALLLNARRNEHGSIDFDLPERVIEFDQEQRMTNITRSDRNIAHRLIEEFMLAANRAVAGYLLRRAIESLHRVHEKPDGRKVLEFEELARGFGYSMGVEGLHQREIAVRHGRIPPPARAGRPDSYGYGRERGMRVALPGAEIKISPQHYQRLIRKIAGKPEERILSYLMLRSLKQARYAAEPLGHFALGFDEYTHFTSPIRRYPDLIVHRVLKWALEHPEGSPTTPKRRPIAVGTESTPYTRQSLEEIAVESSEAERRASGAERELMDWKTAQFMEEHLGEEFDALIISVQKFGCFVELFEVFVEGLVPLGALEEFAHARCVFRESDRSIVAMRQTPGRGPRGGKGHGTKSKQMEWHLGERIRVRAERIDPMRKRVEFALAEANQLAARNDPG
jgi:ribonuclease R